MRPPFHSWDLPPKPYKRWMPVEKEKIQCTTLKSSGLWTVCSAQHFTVHCRGGWSILVVLHCMKSWRNTEKFTGLCWPRSPVPLVITKLPMSSVEEIICSDEFLWARGIQEQLEFLVHSRVLAGWVSRHSVDGHFLKNIVLFFICCFINCSFWAGPIVQFGCLLFESWPKAWFTVTN